MPPEAWPKACLTKSAWRTACLAQLAPRCQTINGSPLCSMHSMHSMHSMQSMQCMRAEHQLIQSPSTPQRFVCAPTLRRQPPRSAPNPSRSGEERHVSRPSNVRILSGAVGHGGQCLRREGAGVNARGASQALNSSLGGRSTRQKGGKPKCIRTSKKRGGTIIAQLVEEARVQSSGSQPTHDPLSRLLSDAHVGKAQAVADRRIVPDKAVEVVLERLYQQPLPPPARDKRIEVVMSLRHRTSCSVLSCHTKAEQTGGVVERTR